MGGVLIQDQSSLRGSRPEWLWNVLTSKKPSSCQPQAEGIHHDSETFLPCMADFCWNHTAAVLYEAETPWTVAGLKPFSHAWLHHKMTAYPDGFLDHGDVWVRDITAVHVSEKRERTQGFVWECYVMSNYRANTENQSTWMNCERSMSIWQSSISIKDIAWLCKSLKWLWMENKHHDK